MMTDGTTRLGLPFLQAGQAQKELAHNEALTGIDLLLHAAAQSIGDTAPPASPVPGQCWIVGAGATGAWSDRDGQIAGWTGGGWRFMAPVAGMTVWIVDEALFARHDGVDWEVGISSVKTLRIGGVQVVGTRRAAISEPTGGTVVDNEARQAVGEILAALRGHGLIAP